ncbi:hypothetical protein [Nocardia takedensis]|uniref:hypothetical protein n=1 Tax=Nocardia takedensis TaxID=259390 RepID=UPI0002E61407|nr:hypothetical protein [Nocardia takedensis]
MARIHHLRRGHRHHRTPRRHRHRPGLPPRTPRRRARQPTRPPRRDQRRPPRRRQPEPGRTEPLRRLLNPARGPRRARAADRVHALLPALPTSGWPAGLFGRRDAVLLTLAAAGLPFTRIAALRQGDVRIDDDAVTIGHQPQLVLPATGDPHRCPVTIVRRWAAVLIHAPHPGVPALLEHHFTRDDAMPPTAPEPDHRHLPLLTGFDWRGTSLALPGHLAALSPAHLAGLAAARHRADALAADLDELFDRLDRETDELLTRTDLLYSRDDT